ncbi:hypothetical protein ACAG96_05710 [Candidatus Izemoplasma sp. B36]|uniref:hypothetical protein n=1 Tax=Candidatus Izemoplasma sp. B36 TaxID=3242468 RepID=UPI0035569E82
MRIFGRILYALFAVGLFLLAFTYSRDIMMTKYIEDVFGNSLTDENSEYPKYYYFYTSIPDYHNVNPIIEIDSNGYEIMGYEVLQADINNDNELNVETFLYIIVYSDTIQLTNVEYLQFENTTNGNTLDINLSRFKTLNVLNGVNERGYVYLEKDLFLDEDFNKISLIDNSDNILVNENVDIEETDFIIKTFIENYYLENGDLPNIDDLSGLSDNDVFPNKPHVATEYAYIFNIAMAVYFVVIIIMTYMIYFKKKKKRY